MLQTKQYSMIRSIATSRMWFAPNNTTSFLITTASPPMKRMCHTSDVVPGHTFASLIRNCKFTAMGDPIGSVVVGRIYHTVDEDLYIDFGHKFGCVCRLPRDGRGKYLRGTEVKLKINSLELSKRFLGYDKDLSLLEADCTLLGLNK